MTRHLIDLGHTRIAFIGGAHAGRVNQERLAGFHDEMRAAGLDVPDEYVVSAQDGRVASAVAPCRALLALPQPPTAIVCFNDLIAIGATQVLVQQNKRVPHDCSLTGFDNIPIAEFVNPPLTTFNQPKYALGAQAAAMLLKLMDPVGDDDNQSNIVTLRGEIVVRASTAPPPMPA